MTRRGFTLIEMLVVISIIAILSGMVFAVFGMTNRRAREQRNDSLLATVHRGLQHYHDLFGEWPRVVADPAYLTGNDLARALCHPTPDPSQRQSAVLTGDIDPARLHDRDGDGIADDIRDVYRSADWPEGRPLVYIEYSSYRNPARSTPVTPSDEVDPASADGSDLYTRPITGYRQSFELWSAGEDGAFDPIRGAAANDDNRSVTEPHGEFSAQ